MTLGFALLAVMAMSPGQDAKGPAANATNPNTAPVNAAPANATNPNTAPMNAAPANATNPNATALTARFDEGRNLFDGGHYAEAAEIFTRLHAESGDAALLYPAAQSLRLAGRCVDALAAYQGFVDAKEQLRGRAEATGPESRVKRLASDLDYAGARIVEMRTCGGRLGGGSRRAEAEQRRGAGDVAGAADLLSSLWDKTTDPTILPELADLHRTLGDCQQAAALLDLAVTALTPIEVLGEVGAEGSDLTAARNALRRARTAKAAPACVPRSAAKPAVARGVPVATTSREVGLVDRGGQEKVKPMPLRWPLWAAGVGGALLVGGGVFFVLAHQTKTQVETLGGTRWSGEADRLYERGRLYEGSAIALSITGGVVVAAASIYYWVVKRKEPAGPVVQVSGLGTTLTWMGRF